MFAVGVSPTSTCATTIALVDDMLTAADEARLMHIERSSAARARKDPSHPVNLDGSDVIRMGSRVFRRAPRAAVQSWWRERWSGLSQDDLTRKRRRPAPEAVKAP